MSKLDVLKFYLVSFNLRMGLSLIFSDFEPRCSYKIVLIKKECSRINVFFFRKFETIMYVYVKIEAKQIFCPVRSCTGGVSSGSHFKSVYSSAFIFSA